jgi:hypothetical protein
MGHRDLTNQRFGHLVALAVAGRRRGRRVWICRCDCGQLHTAVGSDLTSGHSRSCGRCPSASELYSWQMERRKR